MTISAKPRCAVVKVVAGLSRNRILPVTIHARGGKFVKRQYLSPEQRAQMGEDIAAYFEAEWINGRWWLGKRLAESPERTW